MPVGIIQSDEGCKRKEKKEKKKTPANFQEKKSCLNPTTVKSCLVSSSLARPDGLQTCQPPELCAQNSARSLFSLKISTFYSSIFLSIYLSIHDSPPWWFWFSGESWYNSSKAFFFLFKNCVFPSSHKRKKPKSKTKLNPLPPRSNAIPP